MKHHFIFGYYGNKRAEVETIHESMDLEGVKTIIEPFCGTSAMSFYLSQLYPKRFKYILNDLDSQLMELYTIMKDETKYEELINKLKEYFEFVFGDGLSIEGKERYNSLKKNTDLASWVFFNKYCDIRAGLFPRSCNRKSIRIKLDNIPIIHFLRTENVEFRCKDAIELVKEYKDDKSVLFFLDPPYIKSDNSLYKHRGLEIYPYLHEIKLETLNSRIYIVVCLNDSIEEMFSKYFKKIYPKTYRRSHKKIEHVIISN